MADTLDLLSEPEALTAINKSGTAPDGLVPMVTAVSRVVDALCGPVVVRTVTTELHHGGGPLVILYQRPVTSITTVREVPAPGTIDTLTAVTWGAATDGYQSDRHTRNPSLLSGVLRRKVGGVDCDWYGTGFSVEVTYVAGRYATTATVDARFKAGCAAVLRRLWKRETSTWAQSPTFLETSEAQPTGFFFRAVRPIVEELLSDELKAQRVGLA